MYFFIILDNVKEICGEKYADELDKFWRYNKPFKFIITVDCLSMVRDFHEDLEFRFSLGIESIARRVLAITRGQPITTIGHDVIVNLLSNIFIIFKEFSKRKWSCTSTSKE